MDGKIVIAATRVWPMISALFWLAETALGLVIAGLGLAWFRQEDGFVVSAMVGGGALVVFFGIMMGGASWATVTVKGPIIEMDRTGFRDRRIADRVIPWKAMRWGVFVTAKGARSLQFHTDPDVGLRPRWPIRTMGWVNSLFGYPPHTVLTLGTAKSADDLAEMMSRFRKPSY